VSVRPSVSFGQLAEDSEGRLFHTLCSNNGHTMHFLPLPDTVSAKERTNEDKSLSATELLLVGEKVDFQPTKKYLAKGK